MSENAVVLAFPARAEYLLLARLALSGVTRGSGVDEELLADLKLAVTEACGNVVRHAYDGAAGEVSVRYALSGDVLEMVVEDQGVGIPARDPQAPPPPASGGTASGGRGMSIIKAVGDELDVRPGSDGRGTVVRMTKRLVPAST